MLLEFRNQNGSGRPKTTAGMGCPLEAVEHILFLGFSALQLPTFLGSRPLLYSRLGVITHQFKSTI